MGSYLSSMMSTTETDDPVSNARRARAHAEATGTASTVVRSERDDFESQIDSIQGSISTIDARLDAIMSVEATDDASLERQMILEGDLTRKREALVRRLDTRKSQLDAIAASGDKVEDAAAAARMMAKRRDDLARTKIVLHKSGFGDPAKTKAIIEEEADVARRVDALGAIPGYAASGKAAYVPMTVGGRAAAAKATRAAFMARRAAYQTIHVPARTVVQLYRPPVVASGAEVHTADTATAHEVTTGDIGTGELKMF